MYCSQTIELLHEQDVFVVMYMYVRAVCFAEGIDWIEKVSFLVCFIYPSYARMSSLFKEKKKHF